MLQFELWTGLYLVLGMATYLAYKNVIIEELSEYDRLTQSIAIVFCILT